MRQPTTTDSPKHNPSSSRSEHATPAEHALRLHLRTRNSAVPPHEIRRHAEIPPIPGPGTATPHQIPGNRTATRLRPHWRENVELTRPVVGGQGGVTAVELEGPACGGLLVVRVAPSRDSGGHPELPEPRGPRRGLRWWWGRRLQREHDGPEKLEARFACSAQRSLVLVSLP